MRNKIFNHRIRFIELDMETSAISSAYGEEFVKLFRLENIRGVGIRLYRLIRHHYENDLLMK